MLSQQIFKIFESIGVNAKQFDHFDYAQAFQKLNQQYHPSIERNPKKKKVIQQFIEKAYQKIKRDDPQIKKQKIKNFMHRMQVNKKIHEQKLEAMRFIRQNYDQKSNQLWFYPNFKRKRENNSVVQSNRYSQPKSASRNYDWDPEDNIAWQGEEVLNQTPIEAPNLSEDFTEDRN